MDHRSIRRVSKPIPVIALTAFCSLVGTASAPHTLGQAAGRTRVDVMVEDAVGKPATGLPRDDFEIRADNEARPIEDFLAPSTASPMSVVVLVDITASQYNCPG